MLTDQELQALRNQGNEAEAAADEIAELRAAYALLFKSEGEARRQLEEAQGRLMEIGDYAHDHSTGPAVPDALWEVRSMAYGSGA